MRTFIAVDMSSEIKNRILDYIRSLDKIIQGRKNIKWVKPAGIHITLKFLGEISEERAAAVIKTIDTVASRFPSFNVALTGTGRFPPQGRFPRVIWAGIEDKGELQEIQAHLEDEISDIGFPREKRSFHPHLTLGRVKNPSGLDSVIARLEEDKTTRFGEMTVDKLIFFQSILKPAGAEYKILKESELK